MPTRANCRVTVPALRRFSRSGKATTVSANDEDYLEYGAGHADIVAGKWLSRLSIGCNFISVLRELQGNQTCAELPGEF